MLEVLFASADPHEVAEAIYSAAYHDPDWKWVQEWCLKFIRLEHTEVRWAAATSLGDLAMFHKVLDLDSVLPALHEAAKDPSIRSTVEDSIDLIKHAVRDR